MESVVLTFQGGFVGKKCVIQGSLATSPNQYDVDFGTLYPEDVNSTQVFQVMPNEPVQRLKIIFEESTDFYGRITMYKLDILGKPQS